MSDRITAVIPVARTVRLGSRDFTVWEARLSEIALLQAWLDSTWTDPMEEVWDKVYNPSVSEAEADRIMFAAHDAAVEGPPCWDDERGRELYRTAAGLGVFLMVVLSRGTPSLSKEDIVKVLVEASSGQLAALRRVFFGSDSARELSHLLLGRYSTERPGRIVLWPEAIDELSRERNWTYSYIYSLTLSEFRSARRHGEPSDTGVHVSHTREEEVQADILRRRGESPPEATPAAPIEEGEPWVYPSGDGRNQSMPPSPAPSRPEPCTGPSSQSFRDM